MSKSSFNPRAGLLGLLCLGFIASISYLSSENQRLSRDCQERLEQMGPEPSYDIPRRLVDNQAIYTVPGLKLYIHTAFLDTRVKSRLVRIFGLEAASGTGLNFTCKWSAFDEQSGDFVTYSTPARHYWLDRSMYHYSTFFASEFDCVVPPEVEADSVTLQSNKGHKFDIKIEQSGPSRTRQTVAACLTPVTNFQRASWMAEWLEYLKAAGLRNVIVYDGDLHGTGKHLLEYYALTGDVVRFPFPYLLAAVQKSEQSDPTPQQLFAIYGQIELIALHDCLYRFRRQYNYLAMINIGDIFIPDKKKSIQDVIRAAELQFPNSSAFTFNVTWHWEDFGVVESGEAHPDIDLYVSKFPVGAKPNGVQTRPIVATDFVISLNHFNVLQVPSKHHVSVALPEKGYASVHHFRGKCRDKFNEEICKQMINNAENYDYLLTWMEDGVRKELRKVYSHLQL